MYIFWNVFEFKTSNIFFLSFPSSLKLYIYIYRYFVFLTLLLSNNWVSFYVLANVFTGFLTTVACWFILCSKFFLSFIFFWLLQLLLLHSRHNIIHKDCVFLFLLRLLILFCFFLIYVLHNFVCCYFFPKKCIVCFFDPWLYCINVIRRVGILRTKCVND